MAQPAGASGPGQHSAPEWFPLHRNIDGSEIRVGCTYLSRGTQGGYDCAGHHPYWALDFIAGTGTSIYAAGAGYARDVTGQGYTGYGNVVVVDHGNNLKSLYAHMSTVLVSRAGSWVDMNTVIGRVGATGTSEASHLHFEATSSGRFAAGSRNPGPLKACHGSQLTTYPQAWGPSTWLGIPWGTHSAFSDGARCASGGPVTAMATAPAKPAATDLVGDPALRQGLGLLGLFSTNITYSAHLRSAVDGSAVAGAAVVMTVPGKPGCSAVTNAVGTAACTVRYGLLDDPQGGSLYAATFAGDAAYLPSVAAGSLQ